jgi:Ca2+-binding RTX toxin-like protein
MADTIVPTLSGLNFTTKFDLRLGSKVQKYTATAQDDASGVDSIVIWFDRKLTDNIGNFGLVVLSKETSGEIWSASRTISEYNPPGTYTVTRVIVTDKIGNERTYSTSEILGMGYNTSFEFIMDGYVPSESSDELSGSNLNDVLHGYAGSDKMYGLKADDIIYGDAGNDTLDGGSGSDVMHGGDGDDLIYVGDDGMIAADKAYGGNGTDTVMAVTSCVLPEGAGVEFLTALGGGGFGFSMRGDSGATHITGTTAHDTLVGGGGQDTLDGGYGNDIYEISNSDMVIRDVHGIDTVKTTAGFTLTAGLENLLGYFHDSTSLVLKGNASNNKIVGGSGKDKLYGGLGADTLEGGFGKDVFVLDTAITKSKNKNIEKITDFWSGQDAIWLENKVFQKLGKKGSEKKPAKLSDAAFSLGTRASDASDRIILNEKSGKLYYDPDGIGAAKQIQIAFLPKKSYLTHKDFLII